MVLIRLKVALGKIGLYARVGVCVCAYALDARACRRLRRRRLRGILPHVRSEQRRQRLVLGIELTWPAGCRKSLNDGGRPEHDSGRFVVCLVTSC